MTSEKIFEEACEVMPGGVNSPVRAYRAVGMTPRFIERASGSKIYDIDGREYIDYIGSWGPMILGHAEPSVIKAVTEAVMRGTSYGAPTVAEVEIAEMINEAVPCFFLGFYLSLISIKYHSIKPTIAIVRGIVLFYLVSIFIPKDFFFVIIALVIIVYIVSALSLFNNVLRIPFITIKAFNAQLWTMFLSSSSIIICIIIQIVNFIIYELLRI